MLKLNVQIDKESLEEKPNKSKTIMVSGRITDAIWNVSVEELAHIVGNKGHTFLPAVLDGVRDAKHFVSQKIFALDFDDVRTRELPKIFKGYKFITIKLVSSNSTQIEKQMIHRYNNEGGLYDIDNIVRSNEKIKNRGLLPNEVLIDVFGKTKEDVLKEAINIIDNFNSKIEYEYELDDENNYLSWVQSKNLK